jgi:hypothetical protein
MSPYQHFYLTDRFVCRQGQRFWSWSRLEHLSASSTYWALECLQDGRCVTSYLYVLRLCIHSVAQLALQTTFQTTSPHFPHPYPSHPIFTRIRDEEIESGRAFVTGEVIETSFYRNTYSMVRPPFFLSSSLSFSVYPDHRSLFLIYHHPRADSD